MKTKPDLVRGFLFLLAITLSLALFPILLQAKPIGEDPPYCCKCENRGPCPEVPGGSGSAISLTEGNLKETYKAATIKSSNGPTIDLSFTYNSDNADGSRAQVDTVRGYGGTNSYNTFLFSQRGHMFRMDGQGRVTTYRRDGFCRTVALRSLPRPVILKP
jgi:hypothetical protein